MRLTVGPQVDVNRLATSLRARRCIDAALSSRIRSLRCPDRAAGPLNPLLACPVKRDLSVSGTLPGHQASVPEALLLGLAQSGLT